MRARPILGQRRRIVIALILGAAVVLVAIVLWLRDVKKSTKTSAVTGSSTAVYPGMPPVIDPSNIYSETSPGHLSAQHYSDPKRVYVPNGSSNTVTVIDSQTRKVVATLNTA